MNILDIYFSLRMARNEEKQFCRLNRLLLQQQREEEEKRNPKRPPLASLESAAEIRKWLPTITKDMDFYLKQSKVLCYPERKIVEFNQEIEKLRREHQAFVRRLRQLEPTLNVLPGTDRPYASNTVTPNKDYSDPQAKQNRRSLDTSNSEEPIKKLKRIALPILDSALEQVYAQDTALQKHRDNEAHVHENSRDSDRQDPTQTTRDREEDQIMTSEESIDRLIYMPSSILQDLPLKFKPHKPNESTEIKEQRNSLATAVPGTNALGLEYSESSSEEDNDCNNKL